jgi:hypothetical protein
LHFHDRVYRVNALSKIIYISSGSHVKYKYTL